MYILGWEVVLHVLGTELSELFWCVLVYHCLAVMCTHVHCSELLRRDSNNSDALYAKALCHYYQDQPDKANMFFQRALRADPDHRKSRLAMKVHVHLYCAVSAKSGTLCTLCTDVESGRVINL